MDFGAPPAILGLDAGAVNMTLVVGGCLTGERSALNEAKQEGKTLSTRQGSGHGT